MNTALIIPNDGNKYDDISSSLKEFKKYFLSGRDATTIQQLELEAELVDNYVKEKSPFMHAFGLKEKEDCCTLLKAVEKNLQTYAQNFSHHYASCTPTPEDSMNISLTSTSDGLGGDTSPSHQKNDSVSIDRMMMKTIDRLEDKQNRVNGTDSKVGYCVKTLRDTKDSLAKKSSYKCRCIIL